MKKANLCLAMLLGTTMAFAMECEAQVYNQQGQPVYNSVPGNVVPNQGTYQQGVYGQGINQGTVIQGQGTIIQGSQGTIIQGQPMYQNQQFPNNVVQPGVNVQNRPITLAVANWAQAINFGDRKYDFGPVPRASKQEHVFEFTNTLDQTLHMTGIRTSCGCTKPQILTPMVAPGETGRILAKYDTKSFVGKKAATVSVTIRKDQPYVEYGEVQFRVSGKIRQDVVLNPEIVQFATLSPGDESSKTVDLKYAGDWRWKILEAKSSNPNMTVNVVETSRNQQTGMVGYQLTAVLSGNQPVGMFNDQITLFTNDRNGQAMKVNVSGRVKPIIESSPVKLGTVIQGNTVAKRMIIQGVKPFTIKEVRVNDPRVKVESGQGEKQLHMLSYSLDTSELGSIDALITIVTDVNGQGETTVPFSAQIIESTNTNQQ